MELIVHFVCFLSFCSFHQSRATTSRIDVCTRAPCHISIRPSSIDGRFAFVRLSDHPNDRNLQNKTNQKNKSNHSHELTNQYENQKRSICLQNENHRILEFGINARLNALAVCECVYVCVCVLQKANAKGGVAAWSDVQKSGATLGNLTPADRHGSVQVRYVVHVLFYFLLHGYQPPTKKNTIADIHTDNIYTRLYMRFMIELMLMYVY